MILPEHNAVFVHVPKTGGISVNTALLDAYGLSRKELSEEEKWTFLVGPNDDPSRGTESLGHLQAREYVDLGYLTVDRWERAFTFAVVRDPYERIASEYRYRHGRDPQAPSFRQWIFDRFPEPGWGDLYDHVRTQHECLHDADGQLLVDRVIRFEQLEEGYAEVAERLGIDRNLPFHNRSKRRKRSVLLRALDGAVRRLRGSGHVYPYDAETRTFVRDRYALDFEAFGYPT